MPLVHSVYSPAPTILQLRQVVTTPWHGSRILDVLKASPLASYVPSVACILADPHTDADKEEDLTAHPHLPKFEPLEELAVYRGGGTHLNRVVMHAPEALVYGVVTALFGAGVREACDPWLLNRLIARDMRRTAGHLLRKLSKDDQGGGPGPGPGPGPGLGLGQRLQEDFVFQLQVPRGPVPLTGTIHDDYVTFSSAQLQWLRDEHGVDVIGVFLLKASGMQGTWRVRRAVASNCLGAIKLAYRSSPDLLVNLLPLLGSLLYFPSIRFSRGDGDTPHLSGSCVGSGCVEGQPVCVIVADCGCVPGHDCSCQGRGLGMYSCSEMKCVNDHFIPLVWLK
jgi:hypothetical protein